MIFSTEQGACNVVSVPEAKPGAICYPKAVVAINSDFINEFLIWAHEAKVSDVELIPNDPIWVRLHGQWHAVSDRRLSGGEIGFLLNNIARQANASSMAQSGQDVDFAYEVSTGRGKKIRFRCNATGCKDGWGGASSIVMRAIPEHPPEIGGYNLDPGLLAAFQPKYGLVLVTGPVGSGKSTLLFSVLRHIAETQRRNILTYESPIEFDLMTLPSRLSPVVQTEIPAHLKSFEVAPRNSLRRAGDVVLFGESRDRETLKNMSIEAETGVAVYSTVHTNSVEETVSRMIREFSWEERDGMNATINAALRLIVHQRLVPNVTGDGRIALRSHLAFTEEIRNELATVKIQDLITVTRDLVDRYGHSLKKDAQEKFEQGLIAENEYRMFLG
jgi:defect-in-organelle-trafficking protein DotB